MMDLPTLSFLLAAWPISSHTYASSGNKTITVRGRNLGADDNCNPASKVVNAVVTLPVPTITQLTVLNDRDIQLDFNSQPNILYRLQIAQNSATSFLNLQNVYETTTTTINNLSTDGNFYCFRLGAFDPCNNTTVYSNTICSSNFDVTAVNNQNQLSWVTSSTGVGNYTFSKNSAPPLNAGAACYFFERSKCYLWRELLLSTDHKLYQRKQKYLPSKCATAISTNVPTVVENISTNRRSRQ
jgi:hypothetical protein